jgi:hypothetical protein
VSSSELAVIDQGLELSLGLHAASSESSGLISCRPEISTYQERPLTVDQATNSRQLDTLKTDRP